jgi:diadenosine tetraphosphate (Ap4A) HIT family hydrolase
VLPAIILSLVLADVRNCACDVSKPETMQSVNCSLCREAEKQPVDQGVFFLKDTNPTKSNRTLVLPRKHTPGPHSLSDLSAADRTELFTAAIAKGKELWGKEWGVAYNGEERRTQCHAHLHVGKLLDDAETAQGFVVVKGPADIVIPTDGTGFWFHEVDGKLHEHMGAQVNEFVLMR